MGATQPNGKSFRLADVAKKLQEKLSEADSSDYIDTKEYPGLKVADIQGGVLEFAGKFGQHKIPEPIVIDGEDLWGFDGLSDPDESDINQILVDEYELQEFWDHDFDAIDEFGKAIAQVFRTSYGLQEKDTLQERKTHVIHSNQINRYGLKGDSFNAIMVSAILMEDPDAMFFNSEGNKMMYGTAFDAQDFIKNWWKGYDSIELEGDDGQQDEWMLSSIESIETTAFR